MTFRREKSKEDATLRRPWGSNTVKDQDLYQVINSNHFFLFQVLPVFLTTGPTDQLQHQDYHYMLDCDISQVKPKVSEHLIPKYDALVTGKNHRAQIILTFFFLCLPEMPCNKFSNIPHPQIGHVILLVVFCHATCIDHFQLSTKHTLESLGKRALIRYYLDYVGLQACLWRLGVFWVFLF